MASIQQAFNQILGSLATVGVARKHFKGQEEQTSAVKEQTQAVKEQTEAVKEQVRFPVSEPSEKTKEILEKFNSNDYRLLPNESEPHKSLAKILGQQEAEKSAVSSLSQKLEQKQNANVGFKERQSILLDAAGRNIRVMEKYVEEDK